MENLIQTLNQVNWDFSDYNSLRFPLDINSISWYPATFPPPIPKFLIALLTKPGDIVFDPFGGSGTTIIEAIKQDRHFLYNDLNPFAANTVRNIVGILLESSLNPQLLRSVRKRDGELFSGLIDRIYDKDAYEGKNADAIKMQYPKEIIDKIISFGLSEELIFWYHVDTLNELLKLYELIDEVPEEGVRNARKCAFTAILKEVCSQRGHFTYVTDNCRPPLLRYYNAISIYLTMLDRLIVSIDDFLRQFAVVNAHENLPELIRQSLIHCGDSRELNWIQDQSVDFILTSPPYLCAQDYIKTMRLINLFFPNEGFDLLPSQEIGARANRKKRGQEVVNKFYDDMKIFVHEAERVLKNDKFFCFIMGQGKAKAIEGYDTVSDICTMVVRDFHFQKIFETSRAISYKWNRLGGVNSEKIVVFQKRA